MESATAEAEGKAALDAAHFELGFQMAARRINAFDVQMPDTRGAMRGGSVMRCFFAFSAQVPHFTTPGIDQMPKQALGLPGAEMGDLTVRYHG